MCVLDEGEDEIEGEGKVEELMLDAAPESSEAATPDSERLIGDPKLSEIRRLLQQRFRIPATFHSGDLICGLGEKRIALRREAETNRLLLEGPICPEYYAVRALLYQATVFVGI